MLVLSLFTLLTAVALPSIVATPALLTRTTSLILLVSALLAGNALCTPGLGSGVAAYSGLLSVTPVALSADMLVFMAGAIAIMPWAPMSSPLLEGRTTLSSLPTIGTYPLFILFTTCGATCLLSSADLITLYLGIELQSFAVYVLAALYRDSESATHAGLLYFLLGGLSSSLILLGSALIYADTGHTNLDAIMSLLAADTTGGFIAGLGPTTVGFTVLAVGLLFKITAAPFHNWGPDVYDGVPTIVTTWLAVLPKVSILALLLELSSSGTVLTLLGSTFDAWSGLLLVTSLLSLLVGTIVGLAQVRIKRLLAYSTISHVGFLLLALAVHSEEGLEAYTFYLGQYTLTALNAFLTVLALGYAVQLPGRATGDLNLLSELKGLFNAHPLLGLSLAASLFSMAGVPPLVGFFGKQAVLYSAMHAGHYFMSVVAIIVSVVSASYYLRVVRLVHFEAAPTTVGTQVGTISPVHSYTIAFLTLIMSLFIASPGLVLDSASLLAAALYTA